MALIIVDHELKEFRGHAVSFASEIMQTPVAVNQDLRIIGHSENQLGEIDGISIEPRLLGDVFDRKLDLRPIERLQAFQTGRQDLCDVLKTALLCPDDLLIFPTATPAVLAGVADYLAETSDPPSIALMIMMPSGLDVASDGQTAKATDPIRLLLTQLAWAAVPQTSDKCLWFTSNPQHALDMMKTTSQQVPYLDLPMAAPLDTEKNDRTISLFLGDARPEKGFDLTPEIVSLLSEQLEGWRFTIQVTHDPADEQSAKTLAKLAVLSDQIPALEILPGYLSRGEYEHHLAKHDIIVMGYDPKVYGSQSSGVLLEAIAAGCLTVVPDKTWLSREQQRLDAPTAVFDVYDGPTIAKAIVGLTKEAETAKSKARDAAAAYQQTLIQRPFISELVRWWQRGELPGLLPSAGPIAEVDSALDVAKTAYSGWHDLDGNILWAREESALLAFQLAEPSHNKNYVFHLNLIVAQTAVAAQFLKIRIADEILFEGTLKAGSHQLHLQPNSPQRRDIWIEISGYKLSNPTSGDKRKLAIGLLPDFQVTETDAPPLQLGSAQIRCNLASDDWYSFGSNILWARQTPALLALQFDQHQLDDAKTLQLELAVAETDVEEQALTIRGGDQVLFSGLLAIGSQTLELPLPAQRRGKIWLEFSEFALASPTSGDSRQLAIGLLAADLLVAPDSER